MIIVNIKGGLGNQMFQYAFGRRLSLDRGTELRLDPSGLTDTGLLQAITTRRFTLDVFNIKNTVASPEEIRKAKYPFGIISKGLRFIVPKITRQFNISFRPSLLKIKDGSYVDGFFQDERFFKTYEKEIRHDFTLKIPLSAPAEALKKTIADAGTGSTSLHVRRGDFVHDKNTSQYWNSLDVDYYQKAVEHIASTNPSPVLFIFSDDIAWAKEHLIFPFELHFVSDPTLKDYEEMMLMKECHHHIIANSSFSWWAAWLGEKEGSLTVAPRQWTRTTSYPKSPVPERWHVI